MAIRFAPYWYDRYPRTRRPAWPRLREELTTDVVIVGGGLTGCACAWSFAAAGIKVALLEAETIGGGATAGATGLVREDFNESFARTTSSYGLRAARHLWQGLHRASRDFPAALKRLQVRCDLAQDDLLVVAPREPVAVKHLRREYDARRDAGLEYRWVKQAALTKEAGLEAGAAIRARDAVIDPYRACLGLAQAASRRGVGIFERSAVRRIKVGRKGVEILTAGGAIRAGTVIVATAAPFPDLRALRRHLRPHESYAVVSDPLPAAMRRGIGSRSSSLTDLAEPPHVLRWLRDDRVLFAGADQAEVPARTRDKVLVQRAGQLLYELSVMYPAVSGIQAAWSWAVPRTGTVDGLPFIGPHRNFPRHLFALGEGGHGAAVAWLAARVLLRQYLGDPARGDELFGFARVL